MRETMSSGERMPATSATSRHTCALESRVRTMTVLFCIAYGTPGSSVRAYRFPMKAPVVSTMLDNPRTGEGARKIAICS